MWIGAGKIRYYKKLAVKFANNVNDYFDNNSDIPAELVRNCEGENVFSQQNNRVC